jgi:hypothetical protein
MGSLLFVVFGRLRVARCRLRGAASSIADFGLQIERLHPGIGGYKADRYSLFVIRCWTKCKSELTNFTKKVKYQPAFGSGGSGLQPR